MVKDTKLYELLGVEPTATPAEINKAFKLMAIKVHPDKNPGDEQAKANFQALLEAHEILKDPIKRKRYDTTGFAGEESDAFNKAYEYYRENRPPIEQQDIEAFEKRYKNSDEETQDLTDFYEAKKGDVSGLLEHIILSRPDEVDRFLDVINKCIELKTVPKFKAYEPSIPLLRANAVKLEKRLEKERKQWEKENKKAETEKSKKSAKAEAGGSMQDLMLAIRGRNAQGPSFLDKLAAKYGGAEEGGRGGKRKAKAQMDEAEPTEEEFLAAQQRVQQKAQVKVKGKSGKKTQRMSVEEDEDVDMEGEGEGSDWEAMEESPAKPRRASTGKGKGVKAGRR